MVEGSQVGAYRVLHRIGEGGMGSVWLAEHSALGRRAAIKVLHPEFSHRQEIVTRFFNEARAATAIKDPGIVQIFDFGQQPDGTVYIVMELLEGEALDRRLVRQGALPIPDALRIMRQVASALGAAHAHKIIHRDLKPENIFLVRDPEVPGGERAKILDFGIAKLTDDTSGVKTSTQAVMGTPLYMSPEQCRGAGQVDQRSDVYALGCMLFALLVGHPPFVAEGSGELIVMHMREPAPAPSTLRAGIPPEVDQLVLCCLAKDPAQRFNNGGDLAIALGGLIGSSPQHVYAALAHGSQYPVSAAPTTLSSASGAASIAPAPKGKGGLLIGLAAVALVGGGTAAYVLKGNSGTSTDAAAQEPSPKPVAAVTVDAAAAAPKPPPPELPPDPATQVAAPMKAFLAKFSAWAETHAGAACPETLDGDAKDPWGQPFRITCSDQPGDQIIGAISAGPDGKPDTADDLASWQLGRDVTASVHGARWTVAVVTPPTTHGDKPPKKGGGARHPKAGSGTSTSGGVQLDENGLPISR